MIKKAAILAAGEGARLKSIIRFKPIVKINGRPLLEIMLSNLAQIKVHETCVIFNEDEKEMDLAELPSLHLPNINYFFKTTSSSLHSLLEVNLKLKISEQEHYLISMVDSIILPGEICEFYHFCQSLKADESAIIATNFIDDESPLTLEINEQDYITEFQSPVTEATLITSGFYCFSGNLTHLLEELILANKSKMRNFLAEAIKRGFKIKVFKSKKTLDVDRPEDIETAANFLRKKA